MMGDGGFGNKMGGLNVLDLILLLIVLLLIGAGIITLILRGKSAMLKRINQPQKLGKKRRKSLKQNLLL